MLRDDEFSGSGQYSLSVLVDRLAVCRLSAKADIPDWARHGELLSITRTQSELSIVCAQRFLPADVQPEQNWRAFEVLGPLNFNLVGVLLD